MIGKEAVKKIAGVVAVAVALTGVGAPRVEAMTVPTAAVVGASQLDRQVDMAKIQTALESKIIREHLANLQLTPAEIDNRLARLDDQQIHKLALQADKQQAAGDAGATVLVVIAAVALLALIIHLLKRDHDDHHDDAHTDAPATQNNTTVAPAQAPAQTVPAQTAPGTIIVK